MSILEWLLVFFVTRKVLLLGIVCVYQGDQIGRFLAFWAIVYFWAHFLNAKVAQIFGLLFFYAKIMYYIIWAKWVGQHFRRFWCKLIWLHWCVLNRQCTLLTLVVPFFKRATPYRTKKVFTYFAPLRWVPSLDLSRFSVGIKEVDSRMMYLGTYVGTYILSTYLCSQYIPKFSVRSYVLSPYLGFQYVPRFSVRTCVLSVYLFSQYVHTYFLSTYIPTFSVRTYFLSTYLVSQYVPTFSVRTYFLSTYLLSQYVPTFSIRT
jgi:hypothetical protein